MDGNILAIKSCQVRTVSWEVIKSRIRRYQTRKASCGQSTEALDANRTSSKFPTKLRISTSQRPLDAGRGSWSRKKKIALCTAKLGNVEPSSSTHVAVANNFWNFPQNVRWSSMVYHVSTSWFSLQCFCFASRSTTPRRPLSWGAFCKPTKQTRGWKNIKKSKYVKWYQIINHFKSFISLITLRPW